MLSIACPDPTAEDNVRDHYLQRGQRMVRQEDWDALSDMIREADSQRQLTPGFMPVAELLAYGARSDVILAAEHALLDGKPAKDAPLLAGIEALEHVLAERSDDHVIGAIVAQAHMDIGWAWRGTGWDAEVPQRNRAAFAAHFDRARDIVDDYKDRKKDSPLLAGTGCALLANAAQGEHRVADHYETLIDLNPANPRSMRALGNHLLPRWFGSYGELELEARRTAARTESLWGAGGYTWVQFDAIACDDQACANLDVDFFIEGLHDILERRPNAYTANLLAAYCANSVGQAFSGNDQADQNRVHIAECAHDIVRDHLTELHPMIWAHAAQGFDNNLRVRSPARFAASGREDAMRIITSLFSREIAAGHRIVFTETGPQAMPA
ncbi:hypothetical protein BOO69_06360 [Sulfitobacter alexandrii]|uniref:DUF4034 domain-containing protein n=2 Tax=Sulfitobacter alexandrii TaxID=1917485 RepID=A0A1J0WM12_9RHOB|nr:hypothetical protein BOO69_06360 [Sulfitobacter alexandrii]